jgi:lanosterol synthase
MTFRRQAFISQALVESGLAEEEENKEACVKALEWLDSTQIRKDPLHYESAYRHTTKGAWPFSTKEQGYTVSDCTGEGLKAVIYLQEHLPYVVRVSRACHVGLTVHNFSYTPKLISERRLCDAVDVMLSMQNSNGGFASYEKIRGPAFLESINPAEVFGECFIAVLYLFLKPSAFR